MFAIVELQDAHCQSANTAPGPDGIHFQMMWHHFSQSVGNLQCLFKYIWCEHDSWHEAIILLFPNLGKDPKVPSSYRLIVVTSCFCKLLERMVNAHLMWFWRVTEFYLLVSVVYSIVVHPLTIL